MEELTPTVLVPNLVLVDTSTALKMAEVSI